MIVAKMKIYCKLCDSIDNYQYNIKIYDENNRLIFNKETNSYGYIFFNVIYGRVYKIVASNCKAIPKVRCVMVYINNTCSNKVLITFNKFTNNHPVTIKLTDQYYRGLPISKGRVILWKINK